MRQEAQKASRTCQEPRHWDRTSDWGRRAHSALLRRHGVPLGEARPPVQAKHIQSFGPWAAQSGASSGPETARCCIDASGASLHPIRQLEGLWKM